MCQEYRITFLRNIRSGYLTILLLPTIVLIMLIKVLDSPWNIIFTVICLFPIVTNLLIHFSYFIDDYGKEIKVCDENIEYTRFGNKMNFQKEDIKHMEKYTFEKFGIIPWANYKALRIVFKNNTSITITSLSANIEEFMKYIKPVNKQINIFDIWSFLPLIQKKHFKE